MCVCVCVCRRICWRGVRLPPSKALARPLAGATAHNRPSHPAYRTSHLTQADPAGRPHPAAARPPTQPPTTPANPPPTSSPPTSRPPPTRASPPASSKPCSNSSSGCRSCSCSKKGSSLGRLRAALRLCHGARSRGRHLLASFATARDACPQAASVKRAGRPWRLRASKVARTCSKALRKVARMRCQGGSTPRKGVRASIPRKGSWCKGGCPRLLCSGMRARMRVRQRRRMVTYSRGRIQMHRTGRLAYRISDSCVVPCVCCCFNWRQCAVVFASALCYVL